MLLVVLGLSVGASSAQASCTYNMGSSSFSFSSVGDAGLGFGYSSNDLGPGQSQCWYANGWENGFFSKTLPIADVGGLDLLNYHDLIDVDPHGWIDICADGDGLQPPPPWAYQTYSESGQPEESDSSGSGCQGAVSPPRSPRSAAAVKRLAKKKSKAPPRAILFTKRAKSKAAESITFHVYDGKSRKILASACVLTRDVGALSLRPAMRKPTKNIFLGVTENKHACSHAKVAGRERAEKPKPDKRFSECSPLEWAGAHIVRYPAQVTSKSEPSCKKS